jgi:hypothetical protein
MINRKYGAPRDTIFEIGGNVGLWNAHLDEIVRPTGGVETFASRIGELAP